MASGIFSSQSPYLFHAAAGFGSMPLLIGTFALFRPRAALEHLFEFPAPKDPNAQKLVDNLMLLFGARDMFLGTATALTWYYGHRELLGCMMLAGSGVVLIDGAVSHRQIKRAELKHWGFVPVMLVLGGGLLGWFDGL